MPSTKALGTLLGCRRTYSIDIDVRMMTTILLHLPPVSSPDAGTLSSGDSREVDASSGPAVHGMIVEIPWWPCIAARDGFAGSRSSNNKGHPPRLFH